MISREVVTVPRIVPSLRTVAVPMTPTSSKIEFDIHQNREDDKTQFFMTDILAQTNSNVVIRNKRKDIMSKRQSKSEEKLNNLVNSKTMLGINKTAFCKATDKYRKYNRSLKSLVKLAKKLKQLKINETKLFNDNDIIKCVSISKMFNIKYKETKCKQAENHDVLYEVLGNWLNQISFENNDPTEKQVFKECIFHYLFELLEKTFCIKLDEEYRESLKRYIMDHLEPILLDTKENKSLTLHQLAGSLIMEMTCRACKKCNNYKFYKKFSYTEKEKTRLRFVPLSENDIRKFVCKEIKLVTEYCEPKLNLETYKDLEEDLVDFISFFIESKWFESKNNLDVNIEQYIAEIFCDKGLSLKDGLHCARIFHKHLTNELFKGLCCNRGISETFIVCPNYQNIYYKQKNYKPNFTISNAIDEDEPDLEMYEIELCKQIDEWLTDLYLRTPRVQYMECMKATIHDLASDIIDRNKYLKLNLDQNLSNESELEHLKYQIFKWANKHIGESNLELLDHAEELMKRIKHISIILKNRAKQQIKTTKDDTRSYLQHDNIAYNVSLERINRSERKAGNTSNEMPNLSIPAYQSMNKSQLSNKNSCCPDIDVENMKSQDQLESEFEKFVEDWVKEIPIEISDPNVSDISEKARLGIYNGLWKIVSKLNCDPATYYNRFLYEDLLDDAIDDLLNCLPQTQQLQSKRYLLKVKFIEKTVEINDKIKEIEEASFKNKLTKSFITSLRKQGVTRDDNPVKLHEDLQILKIVEDYLLSVRFKDEDKIKSELYKKKLMKEVENFINDLKENHSKELKDIDNSLYKSDIINILQKVPIPNENTMKQEADDVLLAIEIEQWYSDLPVIPNDDYTEQYQRRRQRDILAKKIKALEVNNYLETENELKHEISRFLEKTPLVEGESLNINFMVDELVNRLKNKHEADVSFQKEQFTTNSYDDFSKDVPFHSTATSTKDLRTYQNSAPQKSQCNKSCKNQQKQKNQPRPSSTVNSTKNYSHVVIKEPPSYRMFEEEKPISSSFNEIPNMQWHTLDESHGSRKEHINMQSLPPYNNNFQDNDFIAQDQQNMIPDCCKNAFAPNTSNYPSSKRIEGSGLESSHLPGPSYFDNGYNNTNASQIHSPDQLRYSNNRFYQNQRIGQNERNYEPKRSTEIQTEKTNGESPCGIDCPLQSKISRAINTSVFSDQNLASTPHHSKSLNMPSGPSKRRTRLSVTDKDSAKRHLDFEDSEEEDGPCRCMEKYWKTCLNSKQHSSEEHHCPPYLPIFLPYPYPFM